MDWTIGYILVGLLLIGMALTATLVRRLPLTTALIYLLIGVAIGPHALRLIYTAPLTSPPLWERATEVAVVISLFVAGLRLRVPLRDSLWMVPLRLATVSMVVTVGLIALAGVYGLGLSWGMAILLGAILAPTDPVLASDVQVEKVGDRDRLRFSLTGEAGLNDGTAFPFVMLGLLLLGTHERSGGMAGWVAIDLVYASVAGLAIGAAMGTGVGYLVLYLRRKHREAVGLDEFLSLGLLAASYGVTLAAHGYGFLAAFAAGLALRRIEARAGRAAGQDAPPEVAALANASKEDATDAEKAPAYMAQAVLGFNEQIERICEVTLVILLGAVLTTTAVPASAWWFIPLLFLVIRPIAVWVGTIGSGVGRFRRVLMCWFGVRGIGSIYYLAFALVHGVDGETSHKLIGLTLATVSASIVVHGISVTPLLNLYERRMRDQHPSQPDGESKTVDG